MRHPNSQRYHELLREIAALHDQKQQDYGRGDDPFANVRASEDWGMAPWVGAMVRLTDKVRRLQAFAKRGTLANEGVEDSLKDIAVYALIALVLYEQESHATDLDRIDRLANPSLPGVGRPSPTPSGASMPSDGAREPGALPSLLRNEIGVVPLADEKRKSPQSEFGWGRDDAWSV